MTHITIDDGTNLKSKVADDKNLTKSCTIDFVELKETHRLGMILYSASWFVASLLLCYFVFSLLSCSAVELNLWFVKFSHQTSIAHLESVDFVIVSYLIGITALVAFEALFCWVTLQLVREQRLLKKEAHDFAVRQMDCCRELISGAPQKDGTRRYEITIGAKFGKAQDHNQSYSEDTKGIEDENKSC